MVLLQIKRAELLCEFRDPPAPDKENPFRSVPELTKCIGFVIQNLPGFDSLKVIRDFTEYDKNKNANLNDNAS